MHAHQQDMNVAAIIAAAQHAAQICHPHLPRPESTEGAR